MTDEKTQLLAYIEQQRDGLRNAAYGLTDEQARRTPTAGTLSIGGLIKHVASTELGWLEATVQRPLRDATDDPMARYADEFAFGPDDTLVGALARLDEVAALTEAEVASLDLDALVPIGDEPWNPKDIDHWTVRWVLLHLVEEIARHAGHADIVRESIDGATMYELLAAAEGWPATEWLKPWEPTSSAA
jgi:hypothetical protein